MFKNGNRNGIERDLDRLADLEIILDETKLALAQLVESAIPDDVKQAIQDINDEQGPRIKKISDEIAQLRKKIIDKTLSQAKTVQTERMQAIYSKGRSTWDSPGLKGYAVANPDVLKFQKTGKPSVSIQPRKKEK